MKDIIKCYQKIYKRSLGTGKVNIVKNGNDIYVLNATGVEPIYIGNKNYGWQKVQCGETLEYKREYKFEIRFYKPNSRI